MNPETKSRIERIMGNRSEVWFRSTAKNRWLVVMLSRRRDKGQTVDVCDPVTFSCEQRPQDDALGEAFSGSGLWTQVLSREPLAKDEFLAAFVAWRKHRKPEEERLQLEQEETRQLLESLFQDLPRFTLADRHRFMLQVAGMPYRGIRKAEETALVRVRRVTHCWNCHRHLDNYEDYECLGCGWILCACGACGCPRVMPPSVCPMCGEEFRLVYSRGAMPYCSSMCRSVALEAYSDYLRSPQWQARRQLRLEMDKASCQDCGLAATDVHHLTYKNVGHESPADLISLCHSCHLRRHGALSKDGLRWLADRIQQRTR